MRRADRLFEIIQILRQAGKPITAATLAETLEVNIRTIYRDIAALQATRVPIDGEAGIGYIMRRGYDLAPLMFDVEEIEAITVGLGLLSRTGDAGLQSAAQRASAKIAEILPTERRQETDGGHLAVSTWGAAKPNAVDLSAIRRSLRESKVLSLSYLDEEGKATAREILPLALIYYVQVVVLAGWCRLRRDFRHFRVDRIQSLDETGEGFERDAGSLRQAWEDSKRLESNT